MIDERSGAERGVAVGRLLFVLVLCVAGSACVHNGGTKLGASCSGDFDCGSPFMCKAPLLSGACVANKVCTTTCTYDEECQAHDPGAHCVPGCNEKICLL